MVIVSVIGAAAILGAACDRPEMQGQESGLCPRVRALQTRLSSERATPTAEAFTLHPFQGHFPVSASGARPAKADSSGVKLNVNRLVLK